MTHPTPPKFAMAQHASDCVANVLTDVTKGTPVLIRIAGQERTVTAAEDIPKFHKIAVVDMPKGTPIFRGRYKIGFAEHDITAGDWVHVHNMKSFRAVARREEADVLDKC